MTWNMPYLASIATVRTEGDGSRYFGESSECVAAVKYFAKAPRTPFWKKGALVKNNATIRPGTAIATFDSHGKYKGHAAIYDSQTSAGLIVYDQWNGREFDSRLIPFRGRGYASNDGEQFYVIE